MRQSVGRQLSRYLLLAWCIGMGSMTLLFWITHDTMHSEDWGVVIGTAAITGAVFMHFKEVWKLEERIGFSKRNQGVPS